jgi:hypothetical protein
VLATIYNTISSTIDETTQHLFFDCPFLCGSFGWMDGCVNAFSPFGLLVLDSFGDTEILGFSSVEKQYMDYIDMVKLLSWSLIKSKMKDFDFDFHY